MDETDTLARKDEAAVLDALQTCPRSTALALALWEVRALTQLEPDEARQCLRKPHLTIKDVFVFYNSQTVLLGSLELVITSRNSEFYARDIKHKVTSKWSSFQFWPYDQS